MTHLVECGINCCESSFMRTHHLQYEIKFLFSYICYFYFFSIQTNNISNEIHFISKRRKRHFIFPTYGQEIEYFKHFMKISNYEFSMSAITFTLKYSCLEFSLRKENLFFTRQVNVETI